MDVRNLEPIHWSCNDFVHERALKVKPSLRLPHPWLMLKVARGVKPGAGVLIIGPPPGRSNDKSLLDCLREKGITSGSFLIKYRGKVDQSREFWEKGGFKVVTAGKQDDLFYDRLFSIIDAHAHIVSGTLSSALFFAASIGKTCSLLENYRYIFYDLQNAAESSCVQNALAPKFINMILLQSKAEYSKLASEVLGNGFLGSAHDLRREFCCAIENLREPVFFNTPVSPFERKFILMLSLWQGKVGLINHGLWGYLRQRISSRVELVSLNEIDIWLNGANEENFSVKDVKYRKNVTEPGWAVDEATN